MQEINNENGNNNMNNINSNINKNDNLCQKFGNNRDEMALNLFCQINNKNENNGHCSNSSFIRSFTLFNNYFSKRNSGNINSNKNSHKNIINNNRNNELIKNITYNLENNFHLFYQNIHN